MALIELSLFAMCGGNCSLRADVCLIAEVGING